MFTLLVKSERKSGGILSPALTKKKKNEFMEMETKNRRVGGENSHQRLTTRRAGRK